MSRLGGGYYEKWIDFFSGKKLCLVGCKEAFSSYKFNIFESAKELFYEVIPNKHAFSEYENILERLKSYNKDILHILMCGPTACVLVDDLTKAGFRALDLGHLAKAYDWYKNGIIMDAKNVANFYAPDV